MMVCRKSVLVLASFPHFSCFGQPAEQIRRLASAMGKRARGRSADKKSKSDRKDKREDKKRGKDERGRRRRGSSSSSRTSDDEADVQVTKTIASTFGLMLGQDVLGCVHVRVGWLLQVLLLIGAPPYTGRFLT